MKGSPTLVKVGRMLSRLPGIGEKSALRMALFLLRSEGKLTQDLAQGITELKQLVQLCPTCCSITEQMACEFCHDTNRDPAVICVVEDIADLIAIEQAQPGRWRFHVLHGVLSPLDGVTPNDLKIRELLARLDQSRVQELILATNACVEGEATASYLVKLLTPLGIKITRIAQGIPQGSQLEYIDQATLGRALTERQVLRESHVAH